MYNEALEKLDEIVKLSLEYNDDLLNENIASIYSEILHCEDSPIQFQNLLCEVWFLIEEIAIEDDQEITDEIENLITEAKEVLE